MTRRLTHSWQKCARPNMKYDRDKRKTIKPFKIRIKLSRKCGQRSKRHMRNKKKIAELFRIHTRQFGDVRQIHQVVEDIRTRQLEAQGAINELKKTQKKNFETLQQVNENVEKMKEGSKEDKDDDILRKLAEVNSQKAIEDHAEKYQEGTRVFFFEKRREMVR